MKFWQIFSNSLWSFILTALYCIWSVRRVPTGFTMSTRL